MHRLPLLLGWLVVCGACAPKDVVRPEGPKVLSVDVQGAQAVGAGKVKDKVITTEPPWYKQWFPWLPFGEEPRFDANAWRSDLRRIERFYQSRGFYQAEVVREQVLSPEGTPLEPEAPLPDAVRVEVEVREGNPTIVERIELRGLEGLPEDVRNRVTRKLALEEGKVFEEASWSALKSQLGERLRELGHAEATVEGEALVDVGTQRAVLNVEVTPGRRYTFGRIFVSTGPDPVVSPARIIDQARSVIREGDVYSESALADAQSKVVLMGVFGGVKVNRGLVNRQAGTVPVVVEVREAPFHSVRLGVGVGFDAFRSEVRLLGEYTDRDFLGGLRRLNVTGRVGYAWAANILDVFSNGLSNDTSGFIFNVQAQLEQPRIFFQDVSGRLETYVERGVEPAFTYLGGGLKLGFAWRPSSDFSFRPSIAFEGYQLDGAPGLTGISAIGDPSGANVALGCPSGADSCFVPLTYLEQVLEYDKRDNPIAATTGYYLSLSLQEGGGPLSDYAFVRVMPEGRFYETYGGALTIAGRLRLGTLITFATEGNPSAVSPIVSRFFAGGPSSMRGFSSGRLSPMQLVLETPPGEPLPPPETVPPSGAEGQKQLDKRRLVPLGGNGLFDASIEARYRIGQSDFALATFLDAGFVTSQPFGRTGIGCSGSNLDACAGNVSDYFRANFLAAWGLGIRYLTVVGPIRVDFAYRLPIGPPLEVESGDYFYKYDTSCFGFGVQRTAKGTATGYPGAPEGRCVLHLSVGEAF